MGSAANTSPPKARPHATLTVAVAAASRAARVRIADSLKTKSRFVIRAGGSPQRLVEAENLHSFTNSEIGARLFRAESTVKSHLSSAFAKLRVRSRSEAAAMIVDPQGSLGTGILAITSNGETRAA